MDPKAMFLATAERLAGLVAAGEAFSCFLQGEDSDFVRLSGNRVRQAGHVHQSFLSLDLIQGDRHAMGTLALGGALERVEASLRELVGELREQLRHVPPDPFLHTASEVHDTSDVRPAALPDPHEALEEVLRAGEGLDLAGIWSSGRIFRGYANSLGQRNWHESASFNLDWSCFLGRDKAVKSSYAGTEWDPAAFAAAMERARGQLAALQRPAKTIAPGRYRTYLAPAALGGLLGMLGWGGFGLKAHRTRSTPLLKMAVDGQRLHPSIQMSEEHAAGVAPPFTSDGFIKPARVVLIQGGAYRDTLADARSAKEFGVPVNAENESPQALHLAPGQLADAEILARLGTGLYVNNVWYCNFSDPNDCRITGMTRFASFWVEDGQIQAPLAVMRFDDSLYRFLGDQLLGLTRSQELLFDAGTYFERSTSLMRLPGALVEDFRLAL